MTSSTATDGQATGVQGDMDVPVPATSSSKDSTIPRKRNLARKSVEASHDNNSNSIAAKPKAVTGRSIRKGIQQQQRQEAAEQHRITRIHQQSHSSLKKFYLALVLNFLLILMGAILYVKPDFFFAHLRHHKSAKREWPPRHLALLYPAQVSPRKDLPNFFQQYAIATDENIQARHALRHLLQTRKRLKPYSILLTGWSREEMLHYPMEQHCGEGLQAVYEDAVARKSIRHSEDLLFWCLLRTYQNDGFLQWNMTFDRAPTSLLIAQVHESYGSSEMGEENLAGVVKGLAVKYVTQNRIHPSVLWIPKRKEIHVVNTADEATAATREKTRYDMDTKLPMKMLAWLLQEAPRLNAVDYPKAVEEYLYYLMQAESEKWLFLHAICDNEQGDMVDQWRQQIANQRVVARECHLQGSSNCCTIYMPDELEDPRVRQLRNQHNSEDSSGK